MKQWLGCAVVLFFLVFGHNIVPISHAESISDGIADLAYVNDFARIIEPSMERKIAEIAAELDRKTGTRLVVITIESLDGQPVEAFTKDLMENWHPLGVDKSKVVLILDAVAEQKVRIELGAGMDSLISNEASQRVRQQVMLPNLRMGNRAEAYYLAVTEIAAAIAQSRGIALYTVMGPGFLRNLPAVMTAKKQDDPEFGTTLAIIFIPIFVLIFWLARRQFRYGKYVIADGPLVAGGESEFPDHKFRLPAERPEKFPDGSHSDAAPPISEKIN